MKKIAIALIIISSAVLSKNALSQNSGQYFHNKAYEDMDNKNYQDALGDINKAMPFYENDDKTTAQLYYDRAFVLNKLERYESAVSAATNAITLNAKLFDAYVQRGKSYLNLMDYQHAIDDETVAITHIKKDDMANLRSAYVTRSSAERRLKDFSKSLDDCAKLISLDSKSGQGYWERGITYNASGEYAKAIKDFTTAMTYYPYDEDLCILYDNRATAQRNLDNYTEALADDSIAIVRDPASGLGYWGKASTLKQMEKYKPALKNFIEAIAKYTNDKDALSRLYLGKALCEENLEEYANAVKDAGTSITFNPELGNAYWVRGYCYEQIENYKAAIDDATSALKYYADDSLALNSLYCNRGHAKTLLRLYGKAMEDYTVAISADPNTGRAYKAMAFAYQDSGLYQQAIDEFTKTLGYYKEDNKSVQANIYSNIGFDYSRLKNYQQAVDNESKAIAIDSAHTYSYCERGRNYMLLNKNADAMSDFKKALQLDTTDRTYAYSLFYSGNTTKAFNTLQRKISDTATNKQDLASAYYDVACLYALQNSQKEALAYLKKAFDTGHSKYLAFSDPDLTNIASTPEFKDLFK